MNWLKQIGGDKILIANTTAAFEREINYLPDSKFTRRLKSKINEHNR